ncbi:hypothetical protein OF83DRAFT_1142080 [Amylostereum chailletii]|nr:hypothetical protein OF83DRAFT_1142080 [Amylostereum chailletii]
MSEYLPEGTSKPRHEAVYNKILTYQAKNDFTVRIALMDSDPASGKFHTVCITNPFSEEPIEEPIFITGGKTQDVTFDKGEGAHGDSVHGCIGVTGGNGFIKMRKVWEKITDDECNELFEGYWRVKVQHGAMLRRKGHGPSTTFDTPFWAVRAREGEDGKEIGIEAGGPVSRPPSPDDDNGNDDDEWDSGEDEDEEFGCSYDSDGGASYDSWDEYDDFYGASSNGKKGLGPRLTPEEAGDYYLFGIMPARYRGGPSRPTRPRTH